MRSRLAALISISVLAVAACSSGASGSDATAAPTVDLTVYGAASLKGALDRARTVYESARRGTTLTISTDASSTLETQIEQGAPADVFLSADTTNPKKLVDKGLGVGAPLTFARNKLVLIVPTANRARITTPADLARPGIKVIAAGETVPITKYATRLVATLAELPGNPADLAIAYAANIASREDNVKAVVAKIELGEGDAAIVYVTDAKASIKVSTIEVPDAANLPIAYNGVVVQASKHAAAARMFLDWFAGPDGQAILSGLGFLPPS